MNFHAWQATGTFPADTVPVCRFFGAANEPTEHVFTANAAECAALKGNPRWTFEGEPFRVRLPAPAGCTAPDVAVVRYYKAGSTVADSRHRYLLSTDTVTDTTGWVEEGPVFCVRP